jgi:histidyl-tRNA synthetase
VYFVVDEAAHRGEVLTAMAELRGQGLSCDTDYAGRSLKGQLTQAQKRAAAVAIRTSDGWTLRRRGEQDRSGPALKELL